MDNRVLLKEKKQELQNVLNLWAQDVEKASKTKNFVGSSPKCAKQLDKIADKYAATLVELEDAIAELEILINQEN